MKILAFTGPMGSGKSTAVRLITRMHSGLELVKFAQPLYDIQEYIYDRIGRVYTRPEDFVKDRKLLQFLGTEWGRSLSPSLWIDLWKKEVSKVKHLRLKNYLIVNDDLRFDNEAEAVKSLGGIIVKLQTSKNRIEKINTGHASESGVDFKYVDYLINNDGDIDDLQTELLTINDKEHLW